MTGTAAAAIPIVDITGIDDSVVALERAAESVAAACTGSGFFYIAGHGVPQQEVDDVFEANRRFHARPEAEKLAIRMNRWHRGYQPFATSTLKSSARFAPARHANQLESYMLRHEVAPEAFGRGMLDGPNQWPADDAWFREAVGRYDASIRALGHRMLRVFSVAVGEAPDFFAPFFAPASTTLRLIHYPPAPAVRPEDLFGIHPHTDYGFLTLLAQDDVGGLEVRHVDGTWLPATPIPGTFVLNVCDALARWTNERFNSTPHRVINRSANRDRYSVAMFFDPNVEAEVRCLPAFTGAGAKHPPVRYGDYYRERLDANYPVGVARA